MVAAIWGTGNIAHTHVKALRANGIDIKSVVNINPEKARLFAEKWDIPHFGGDPSLLYDEEIDCVHLCTPPALHYDMLLSLFSHNKNVLCEKPLCFNRDEAIHLVEEANKRALICGVNFNVRFHAAVSKAQQIIAEGELGTPLLIHGSYLQEFHALPAPFGWRYDPRLAGPMRAVTEIGSHWFDIIEFVSGERISVVSSIFGNWNHIRSIQDGMMQPVSSGSGNETVEVCSEDAAVIQLKFENNAIGSVVLSEVSQGRVNRLSFEVTGAHKSIWWNSEDSSSLHSAKKGKGTVTEVFPFEGGFSGTFESLFREFYKDIKAGKPSKTQGYPTLADGVRNVTICSAVYDSARSDGTWIKI